VCTNNFATGASKMLMPMSLQAENVAFIRDGIRAESADGEVFMCYDITFICIHFRQPGLSTAFFLCMYIRQRMKSINVGTKIFPLKNVEVVIVGCFEVCLRLGAWGEWD